MDGLENLGTGLLQGYQFGLQQKRLQKADERQAVQDAALAKSQELQNRTNEFSLQAAQTKQGWSEEDHLKSQKLNQSLNQVIALKTGGDIEGAFKTLTAANNDPAFGSPYKTEYVGLIDGKDPETGKPAKLGKIRYINNADGTVMGEADLPIEKATVMFAHTHDPVAAMDKEQATKDAAAVKAADRKNALADAITLDDHKTKNDLKVQDAKDAKDLERVAIQYGLKGTAMTNNGRALLQKQEQVDDGYGGVKVITSLDNDKAQNFFAYATSKNLKGNDADVQEWIGLGMPKAGNTAENPKAAAAMDAGVAFIKGKKIKNNSELAAVMKELKGKGWTKEQINAMLDKAGL